MSGVVYTECSKGTNICSHGYEQIVCSPMLRWLKISCHNYRYVNKGNNKITELRTLSLRL